MALSIIEFGVYGFITYSSMLMLIISVIKEVPTTKYSAITRSIYLIPGIVCAYILASSGVQFSVDTVTTTNLIRNENSTETWTEATNQTHAIILEDPVWITVHFLFFVTLIVYVVTQVLILFTKHDKMDKS